MSIGLKGNSDGSGAVQIGGSDAISITTGLNTTFAGTVTATGTVAGSTGTLYPLTSGTAVASTSGTAIDFTGIPSWVKRITVMFNGVSTNGSSQLFIQIGSGSVETSGYVANAWTQNTNSNSQTTGFVLTATVAAATTFSGTAVITTLGSNVWVCQSVLGGSSAYVSVSGGTKTTSGTLDRVRITTSTGTDTFDAGSINILYE